MPKWVWYAAAALVFYWLFLRRSLTGAGMATGTISVGTGANATPYPGYPPGYAPIGAQQNPGASYGPMPPQPIYVQQGAQGNSTAATIGAVGQLIGGVGSAAGAVLGALGQSGVIGSGGSNAGYSGWSAPSGGWGGAGSPYPVDDLDW